ncbi:MAG: acyl-CoA dehydrogenase family protein [Hellea sp.]
MIQTPHDALSAAQFLATELSARAQEMDTARRLPADLAATMAKAGVFRALTPASLGGMESLPAVFMEMLETLAMANASASWCTMIACTAVLPAAYLAPDVARDIYGDLDMIAGGIFAPMGRAIIEGDDYILTGRWPWGSGSANSQWIGLGAMVAGENETMPEPRMLMVRTKDVELLDTWHVAGLRGTGSGDIAVKELRVPKTYSILSRFENPRETSPLYTFPPFGLLGIGVASVALGNAQGALNEFYELASAKKSQGSSRRLSERASVQADYAKALASLKAARAYMVEEIALTWEQAKSEGAQSVERRAALRLACTHMTHIAAKVCRVVYELGGGTVLYENSPIQRRFRDAHAITQHIVTAPASYELFGRVLFEQPTNASMI